MPERVFLAAVDGLDWTLVRKGLQAGRLPNLARMIDQGAWAEVPVRSAAPGLPGAEQGMLSPVLWTTVATGQYYFQHGVYGFSHPILCPEHPPLFETSHVASPRVWDVLSTYGLDSIVVGYYVTHPAYPIRGIMVGDLFGETESAGVVWPSALTDDLARLLDASNHQEYLQQWASVGSEAAARAGGAGRSPRVLQRVAEILQTFTSLTDSGVEALSRDPARQKERHLLEFRLIYPLVRDERFHKVLLHLLDRQDWRFATVYYRLLDFASHGFWPEVPGRPELPGEAYAEVLNRAYVWMDDRLGEIASRLGPEDRLIVMSDHGFQASTRTADSEQDNDISTVLCGEHAEPALLIVGNGPRRGRLDDVTMLDIAPTILDFFGIPQADNLDGGVVPGMLAADSPRCQADPVRAYDYTPPSAPAGISEAEHQAVLRRLADLGYIG